MAIAADNNNINMFIITTKINASKYFTQIMWSSLIRLSSWNHYIIYILLLYAFSIGPIRPANENGRMTTRCAHNKIRTNGFFAFSAFIFLYNLSIHLSVPSKRDSKKQKKQNNGRQKQARAVTFKIVDAKSWFYREFQRQLALEVLTLRLLNGKWILLMKIAAWIRHSPFAICSYIQYIPFFLFIIIIAIKTLSTFLMCNELLPSSNFEVSFTISFRLQTQRLTVFCV